ncbi:phosphotransferase family protein [Dactylosporangium sp. McL0621]|uniref:phosphotransferase family protein n=1 Tax=Dactylosporangium sp. McL0621 TaxID=3415678 RepID=UPI003CF2BBEA
MTSGLESLSAPQRALVERWLPGAAVERDHSWGLVETTVLEMRHGGMRYILKAGGPGDQHIERELQAHRHWLGPWTSRGRAPELVHGSVDAKVLVTRYLEGELVLGTGHAGEPDVYRQAGELLALLHAQGAVADDDYERRENAKQLARLDAAHRIDAHTTERLRAEIASWPAPPAVLVPTHGDWQTRNWLIRDGTVSVIDFGRAGLRPALTDFARLAVQEFRCDPRCEEAFLAGYGRDPREAGAWHRNRVREAIGTACWAYQVGDEGFEAQGHRMIAEALA